MKLFIFGFILLFLTENSVKCDWLPHSAWDKIVTQIKSITKWVLLVKENVPISEDVKFYLHTKENPDETLLATWDTAALKASTFNPSFKTTFIIHGWGDNKDRHTIIGLRKTLLEYIDTNVIVVDWRRLAGQVYFHAAPSAYLVGKHLAAFLTFLKKEVNIDYGKVHLIGHSLGAQISGIAGFLLNGTIGRITGLDPAGPMFEFLYVDKPKSSLDSTDATFIDVLHTAAEDFGVNEAVGDVDFYPNDGIVPQPGCSSLLSAVSCSHVRSVEFFMESIYSNVEFLARSCPSWVDRVVGKCEDGKIIPMGYYTPRNARGIYFLKTSTQAPFALGKDGI